MLHKYCLSVQKIGTAAKALMRERALQVADTLMGKCIYCQHLNLPKDPFYILLICLGSYLLSSYLLRCDVQRPGSNDSYLGKFASRSSQLAFEVTKLCEPGLSVISESNSPKRTRILVGSWALELYTGEPQFAQK